MSVSDIQELSDIGRFKVRILRDERTGRMTLDIREFVEGEAFSGFTRRGIRLSLADDFERLEALVKEVKPFAAVAKKAAKEAASAKAAKKAAKVVKEAGAP